MTAGLLVAGLGAVALGGAARALRARASRRDRWLQAAGAAASAAAGFWVLATATTIGAGFTSAFDLPLRRGRAERLLPRRRSAWSRSRRSSSRCATSSRRARGRAVALPDGGVPARARALVICARDPLTFLARLGADDAAAGRGDPRRARRRRAVARATVFTYVAVTHLGGAGTWIAILLLAQAGAIGGAAAIERRVGAADRDRAGGARRHGDEGGRDAAARVAAARASDRARAGLGADERRDDQGRDLRARPRARRLGRRAAASGSACSCSRSARCRPSAA